MYNYIDIYIINYIDKPETPRFAQRTISCDMFAELKQTLS